MENQFDSVMQGGTVNLQVHRIKEGHIYIVQSGLVFKFAGTSWAPGLIWLSSTADIERQMQFQDWQQRTLWKDLGRNEGSPAKMKS